MESRLAFRRAAVLVLALSASCAMLTGCRIFARTPRENPSSTVETRANEAATAQAFLDEADRFLNEGNKDAALQAFAMAIEHNPRLYRAQMGIADIYRERGEYGYAEKHYRVAVQDNPRSYEANYFHGLVLQLLDRIAEAIRAYRQALVIEPNSHEANLNIATAYLQVGQATEALPFAQTAVRLQPDHGPSRANLGAILAALGRHEDAIPQYQRAMELMEPSPELIFNFVDSLRATQRYQEMVHALEALIRIKPSPAAHERMGYACFKLRRYPESEQAYRDALGLDQDYFPAMNGLGVNLLNRYIESNRTNLDAQYEAIQLLRRSLQLDREQPRIVDLLSRYGR